MKLGVIQGLASVAILAGSLTAAFTITMSDKHGFVVGEGEADAPMEEEQQRLRPNFGHWWILIKDQPNLIKNVTQPTVEPAVDMDVDAMSVVWYLGAFGGLIAFFMVVTCSEWCCGRGAYGRRGCPRPQPPPEPPNQVKPQTPPPPYHLFAPPPYTETCSETCSKAPVYVIPVST